MEEIKIIKQKERVTKLEEVSKYLSVLDTSTQLGQGHLVCVLGGGGLGAGGVVLTCYFKGPERVVGQTDSMPHLHSLPVPFPPFLANSYTLLRAKS